MDVELFSNDGAFGTVVPCFISCSASPALNSFEKLDPNNVVNGDFGGTAADLLPARFIDFVAPFGVVCVCGSDPNNKDSADDVLSLDLRMRLPPNNVEADLDLFSCLCSLLFLGVDGVCGRESNNDDSVDLP